MLTKNETTTLNAFLSTTCALSGIAPNLKLTTSSGISLGFGNPHTSQNVQADQLNSALLELRKIINDGDPANWDRSKKVISKLFPSPPNFPFTADEVDTALSQKPTEVPFGMPLQMIGKADNWIHLPNNRNILSAGCNAAAHSDPQPWNKIQKTLGDDRANAALAVATLEIATRLINYANLHAVAAAMNAASEDPPPKHYPTGKTPTYIVVTTGNHRNDICVNFRRILQNVIITTEDLHVGLKNRTGANITFSKDTLPVSNYRYEGPGNMKTHQAEEVLQQVHEMRNEDIVVYAATDANKTHYQIAAKSLYDSHIAQTTNARFNSRN